MTEPVSDYQAPKQDGLSGHAPDCGVFAMEYGQHRPRLCNCARPTQPTPEALATDAYLRQLAKDVQADTEPTP